ncbi:MAG: MBL fold metallo-hydrolase [Acetivibrionales bacterium]|jgi:L-ascorbate metabolism protein UlaG (beta-lactamase superfamily)
MGKKIEVWYLGHSGFAVGIGKKILIFDYYLDTCKNNGRSLSSGVIEPLEIKDKEVLVFVSHRHPDHFNPVIFRWKEQLPNVRYFLSSDIPKKYYREWINILKPNVVYQEENLSIQTLKSTDEGIAFFVFVDGINIYHAGDLNWWHWNEESKAWNNDMSARFKHEVSLLKNKPIDIAFLTADPRQESAELMGITYFLEEADVKIAFPMHFGDDYSIMDRIKRETGKNFSFNKVKPISRRGEIFTIDL